MRIIRAPSRLRALSLVWKRKGFSVGFVPTMGALHEGHMSLISRSMAECDRTIVSIFVNPIQFGPAEDFGRYPRPFARDRRELQRAGVHALYAPRAGAMYPEGFSSEVEVSGSLSTRLCAPFRPGHFRGVATVVVKLLNAAVPDALFLGQKDAQQARILARMAKDLDYGVEVRVLPTVREDDGLAMSSRNRHLKPAERKAAPALIRALRAGRAAILAGERKGKRVLRIMRTKLARESLLRIQYLEIVDSETLESVRYIRGEVLLAVAARAGNTRLIDNLVVRVPRR